MRNKEWKRNCLHLYQQIDQTKSVLGLDEYHLIVLRLKRSNNIERHTRNNLEAI
ncbi:hypothetical protein DPMN_081238 [Dreissena polymorpha]|uniref:Uncharacterized protein n=1 Tax=Dreissena polymorpha TaxID=45954 RepID=A0A9D3Y5N0_DREPO|nr:hypothetical protein DPMN_081238 [Dreissena polymorpha]